MGGMIKSTPVPKTLCQQQGNEPPCFLILEKSHTRTSQEAPGSGSCLKIKVLGRLRLKGSGFIASPGKKLLIRPYLNQ
jgi:hypothetical protein